MFFYFKNPILHHVDEGENQSKYLKKDVNEENRILSTPISYWDTIKGADIG